MRPREYEVGVLSNRRTDDRLVRGLFPDHMSARIVAILAYLVCKLLELPCALSND